MTSTPDDSVVFVSGDSKLLVVPVRDAPQGSWRTAGQTAKVDGAAPLGRAPRSFTPAR
jgi:hypothetical protein